MVSKVVILLILPVSSVVALLFQFEGCKLIEQSALADSTLRVRKLNRTTAGLFGNFTLKLEVDESFSTSILPFHSPLGNNQFNAYPMKVGPIGVCEFTERFWGDYQPYFDKYVSEGLPAIGECPIRPRTIVFLDMLLEKAMFPPYVPTGLWKLLWRLENKNDASATLEILIKVYEDGFF